MSWAFAGGSWRSIDDFVNPVTMHMMHTAEVYNVMLRVCVRMRSMLQEIDLVHLNLPIMAEEPR